MNKNFNVLDFFFDLDGRISRKDYWFGNLSISVLILLPLFLSMIMSTDVYLNNDENMMSYMFAYVLLVLVGMFASICLSIKRLHDRNKSGHFLWISFIPLIGGILLLVEAGVLKGTDGANQFGEDPLN